MYCNYSKDKFGNEITCIIPIWCNDLIDNNHYDLELCEQYNLQETENISKDSARFIYFMCQFESAYNMLLAKGWKPQQARAVLPNALKTELVMTGFVSDWKHFFDLRCPESAHPQARELAIPLYKEFVLKNYIKQK